jgi:hypothetical protein
MHQTKEEIEFIAKELNLNEIQIPFLHPQKNELDFDKFLIINDFQTTIDILHSTDFFVIKIKESEIKNQKLKDFISNNKVFIDVELTKSTVSQILDDLHPYGIQITCKKEEKTGISLVDEYEEIIAMFPFYNC